MLLTEAFVLICQNTVSRFGTNFIELHKLSNFLSSIPITNCTCEIVFRLATPSGRKVVLSDKLSEGWCLSSSMKLNGAFNLTATAATGGGGVTTQKFPLEETE